MIFIFYFIRINLFNVEHKILFFSSVLCFIFAISNNVYLGDTILLKLEIHEGNMFLPFFQMGRSSGRFFWLTGLFFLSFSLMLLYYKISNKKLLYVLLSSFVIFQFFDLKNVHTDFVNKELTSGYSSDYRFVNFIKAGNSVEFIDFSNTNHFLLKLAYLSILENKKISQFYMAHGYGAITSDKIRRNKDMFFQNIGNNDSAVYFSPILHNKRT